jgi:hypothetical protein
MSGKRVQEQPTSNLRLNFFSSLSATSPRPGKTQTISAKLTKTPDTKQRNVNFFAECDCACR